MSNAALHAERGDVLEPYLWRNRVLILFASHADHPDLLKLKAQMEERRRDAAERDLVVVESVPMDPSDQGESVFSAAHVALCERFEVDDKRFTAVLVGKDGAERDRYVGAVDPDIIFSRIDKTPRRQEELEYRQQVRE